MGLSMFAPDRGHIQTGARRRYRPPQNIISKSLRDLVDFAGAAPWKKSNLPCCPVEKMIPMWMSSMPAILIF